MLEFLVIVLIIGALLGAKSFGGAIRNGCGCLAVMLFILLIAFAFFGNNEAFVLSDSDSTYFTVEQDCEAHLKPNIKSEVSRSIYAGEELQVKNPNKYKYFYEVISDDGEIYYVLKDYMTKSR